MRKLLRYGFPGAVVVVAAGVAFLALRPVNKVAAPVLTVERTPERVARGKYLFEHASGCGDCHSATDTRRFGHPVVSGTLGQGQVLPAGWGLPGTIVATNLTPDQETGAAKFTDGQLYRAIREGIGHDERVLFPIMPYAEYRHMSDEDAKSIIAFIRTLEPKKNALPPTNVRFPVNLLIKTSPQPAGTVPEPDRNDKVAYGKYLVQIGGCRFCHSPVGRDNQPLAGKEFSGGHEFPLEPGARVVTPNLTPDAETGIGKWTEQEWLDKFAQYKDYAANGPPVVEPAMNTLMPWLVYASLDENDLRAMYAYLRTVPAVANAVVTHPDAPEEKRGRRAQ